ncbi:general stress protein [Lapillicoccus sp.]|uniref:general stress protein n=1 Tax=Lapillicoccus sp. TaxID=1909287 RepID=UPI0027C4BA0B|nr:hypothetical protein [Actinomycetota bacterium]
MSTQPNGLRTVRSRLALEYPMSLGIFEKYEEAQKTVDTLSDAEFPVQNCLIVGTELKQLERVTGRLTWGRVLLGGALSGIWLGLFIGLIFALFTSQGSPVGIVVATVLFGALFGVIWGAITYSLTGGRRDFSSVSLTVPSKYEVLVEHKHAQRAREILGAGGLGGASAYAAQQVTTPAAAPEQVPPPAGSI